LHPELSSHPAKQVAPKPLEALVLSENCSRHEAHEKKRQCRRAEVAGCWSPPRPKTTSRTKANSKQEQLPAAILSGSLQVLVAIANSTQQPRKHKHPPARGERKQGELIWRSPPSRGADLAISGHGEARNAAAVPRESWVNASRAAARRGGGARVAWGRGDLRRGVGERRKGTTTPRACVLLFAAACETLYRNDRQMAMPAVMRVGTRHPRARVVVADPVSCCRSKMGSGPMVRWLGSVPFASSGGGLGFGSSNVTARYCIFSLLFSLRL
jgi:hypothetical protein